MGAAEKLPAGEFTERDAAVKLGISKNTLAAIRKRGGIRPLVYGPRIIRYTEARI